MSTYLDLERSTDNADPYHLYEFRRGGTSWKYTSFPFEVTDDALGTFTPKPIAHGRVNQTGQIERVSLEITLPFTDALSVNQRIPNFFQITTLTIWRKMVSDLTNAFEVVWKGRIVSNRTSGREFTLVCENVHTSVRRAGLRGRFQRSCRHNLYGPGCGLDIEDWYETVSVTDWNGSNVIEVSPVVNKTDAFGYYNGGIVEVTTSVGVEYGFITDHDGNNLALLQPLREDPTSTNIRIAPGCYLNRLVCQEKFNNVLNFGGTPYLPLVNPFTGASIT